MKDESNINNIAPDVVSPVRYHPGLATPEEAKKEHFYQEVRSDHLPFKFDLQGYVGVSWNVLEVDGGSGFAPSEPQANGYFASKHGENEEQQKLRFNNIADSLKKIATEQQPAVILLQEISADGGLLKKIQDELGDGYKTVNEEYQSFDDDGNSKPLSRIASQFGNITLYKEAVFTEAYYQKGSIDNLGILDSNQHILANKTHAIILNNTHATFNPVPLAHENAIRNTLNNMDEKNIKNHDQLIVIKAVIGDFNGALTKEPGTEPQLVTSSVAPACFTPQRPLQHGHYIDGGFEMFEGKIKQLNTSQINPLTGKEHSREEIDPQSLSSSSMPPEQAVILNELRPAICLGELWENYKIIDDLTLFQLEEELRQSSNDNSNQFSIRYACNMKNEQGLSAMGLSEEAYQILQQLGMPEWQARSCRDKDGTLVRMISVPEDQILLFAKAIFLLNLMIQRDAFQKSLAELGRAYINNFRAKDREKFPFEHIRTELKANNLTSFIEYFVKNENSEFKKHPQYAVLTLYKTYIELSDLINSLMSDDQIRLNHTRTSIEGYSVDIRENLAISAGLIIIDTIRKYVYQSMKEVPPGNITGELIQIDGVQKNVPSSYPYILQLIDNHYPHLMTIKEQTDFRDKARTKITSFSFTRDEETKNNYEELKGELEKIGTTRVTGSNADLFAKTAPAPPKAMLLAKSQPGERPFIIQRNS